MKPLVVAVLGPTATGKSALALAIWPTFPVVMATRVLHAGASCVLGPVIAAISLGLVGHLRSASALDQVGAGQKRLEFSGNVGRRRQQPRRPLPLAKRAGDGELSAARFATDLDLERLAPHGAGVGTERQDAFGA